MNSKGNLTWPYQSCILILEYSTPHCSCSRPPHPLSLNMEQTVFVWMWPWIVPPKALVLESWSPVGTIALGGSGSITRWDLVVSLDSVAFECGFFLLQTILCPFYFLVSVICVFSDTHSHFHVIEPLSSKPVALVDLRLGSLKPCINKIQSFFPQIPSLRYLVTVSDPSLISPSS